MTIEKRLKLHYYMDKLARKKSDDPLQEQLRSRKDHWNAMVKDFIARMIAFKRATNGRGDPKFSLPPSKITAPLPSEIVSFLSEMSNIYQTVAQEAAHIIQEQEAYSQARRQPGQTPSPQPGKVATAASKRGKVIIKDIELPTELAISAEEQERGLMFCTEPKIMSFVYSRPSVNKFWMRNTPMPLDLVFSCNGSITNICQGEPFSTRLIGDDSPSNIIVEMPQGTAAKLGIKIGDPLNLIF